MVGLDVKEYAKLLKSVGTHQKERPLSPIQVAKDIEILLRDENIEIVSKRLGISPKQITEFLENLRIPKTTQNLIGWGAEPGRIPFSTGAKIAKLENEDEMDVLTKTTVEHDLKKQEVIDILELRKRNPGMSLSDCIERVLKFRPSVEKGYAVIIDIGKEELQYVLRIARDRETVPKKVLEDMLDKYIEHGQIRSVVLKERFVILTMSEPAYEAFEKLADKFMIAPKDILNALVNQARKSV